MKIFHVIAASVLGAAMAVGAGIALASSDSVVRQTKAEYDDILSTFSSDAVVGGTETAYTEYSDSNWTLTVGGNKKSAGWNKTASNARKVPEKFAIDSTSVTSDTYGWVAYTKNAISNVGKMTFEYTGGAGNDDGLLWLGYSTDGGTTYSKVALTTGTQGSDCGSTNTTYTFEFATIASAKYAIIVTGGVSGTAFRFDSVTAKLYEGVTEDPLLETLSIKLNDVTEGPFVLHYSNVSGNYLFYANDNQGQVDADWLVGDNTIISVVENPSHVAALTTLKPGTTTLKASKTGYNSCTVSVTVNPGTLEAVVVTGSMTKTDYLVGDAWDETGLIATANYSTNYSCDVTSSAAWTFAPAAPAVGVKSVVATATYNEVAGNSVAQSVTVTRTNPLQVVYGKSAGTSVNVYGIFGGNKDGNNIIIMDGEYGMDVYKSGCGTNSYVENETILHVVGKVAEYNGLIEISNVTTLEVVGSADVLEPVVYATKGGETQEYASRKTTVTGIPSLDAGSAGNFEDEAGTKDITLSFDLGNSKTVKVFYKKAIQTADADAFNALKTAVASSNTVTVKGFTAWFNGFQVQMTGLVKEKEGYTALVFAQDLLDQTDAICTGYQDGDDNYSALLTVWNDLAGEEKYPSLPADQKLALQEAQANEGGTVIQQAMARYDHICKAYGLSNFIDRGTANLSNKVSLINNNNIAGIVSLTSALTVISFVGVLMMLRKRKHQ